MSAQVPVDPFGNPIDPILGFALGPMLADEAAFQAKVRHAEALIRARATRGGRFHILTGNRADFPLAADDLGLLTDGWVGPALVEPELTELARAHVGADERQAIAVFNRTSAAVIAAISALAEPGDTVVSLVPAGRAHPCVRRGAHLAGAAVVEGRSLAALDSELRDARVSLTVITPVTSELDAYDHAALTEAATACRARGLPTLVDDAYGARVRPDLLDGPRTFALPVDLAVTNGDKAALEGPRSGLLVGQPELLGRVAARGHELAQEGREPIRLALLRALQRYSPARLRANAAGGRALSDALVGRLGPERVRPTLLGPTISEDDLLDLLLERADLPPDACRIVPAEAAVAVGMLLLAEHGVVTVNALSHSGARPSLRLKPTADALDALGGPDRFAGIIESAIDRVAAVVHDTDAVAALIFG